MIPDNTKFLQDSFQQHLYNSYESYCQRHNMAINLQGFITYLIDMELISKVNIKRFTLQKEFELLFPIKQQKTATIHALSDKFNIPERTVWTALKKGKKT